MNSSGSCRLGAEELVLPLSDARVLVCTETPMAEAETALGAPEVGERIEVYWTGMRAWYPGRVLPLQEEDEEGSMRGVLVLQLADESAFSSGQRR